MEMKNSLEGFTSGFELAKERISKLEDESIDMQPDEQEEKSMKKNKHNVRDLGDTIKHTNVCIMRVKEGEKKKGKERIVEEIIT